MATIYISTCLDLEAVEDERTTEPGSPVIKEVVDVARITTHTAILTITCL